MTGLYCFLFDSVSFKHCIFLLSADTKIVIIATEKEIKIATIFICVFINPEKVNKLVLAVTSSKSNEIINNVVGNWIQLAKKEDFKNIFLDTAEKSYSEKYLKKYRKYYNILWSVSKPKDYKRFTIQANSCLTHNVYDDLDKIKCHTLIIGGKQDSI